jgi:hypothetical protein
VESGGYELVHSRLVPGTFVRHPTRPEWGAGQIQSSIGDRITVNFENAGKRVIDVGVVELEPIEPGAQI